MGIEYAIRYIVLYSLMVRSWGVEGWRVEEAGARGEMADLPELAFPPPQWSGQGWLLTGAQSALLGLGASGAGQVWDTATD